MKTGSPIMTLLPPKLSRFTAAAALLLKYGRMRIAADDPLTLPTESSADDGRSPEELADDLERLGPTLSSSVRFFRHARIRCRSHISTRWRGCRTRSSRFRSRTSSAPSKRSSTFVCRRPSGFRRDSGSRGGVAGPGASRESLRRPSGRRQSPETGNHRAGALISRHCARSRNFSIGTARQAAATTSSASSRNSRRAWSPSSIIGARRQTSG